MKINKTYKCRIYPNKQQEQKLAEYFGATRFIYNYFLNERKIQYEETGKSDNYYAQQKKLTLLKKEEGYEWLNNVATVSMQYSLRNLEIAYTRFFSKLGGFPKFHKKSSRQSFTSTQNLKFKDKDRICFVGFKEGLKCKLTTEIKGKIKEVSVVKYPSGKYYVNIVTEQEIEEKQKEAKMIGIDLGIEHLVTTSDGSKFDNPKFLNKYQKQLADAQRHLSRKVKGSKGFESQKIKVARIQEKIANCRQDNLHKISHHLTNKYSDIFMEDLNVKQMQQNKLLSKLIVDSSWNMLYNMLDYKGKWYGCKIHKINRWYPSSKTCSNCNYTLNSLNLNTRSWICPKCGQIHDRDINAAKNILKEGLRELSAGTVDYTGREAVRLRVRKSSKQTLKKPEAITSLD